MKHLRGHVEPGDAGEVVAHEGGPAAQDPDLVLVEKQLVAIPEQDFFLIDLLFCDIGKMDAVAISSGFSKRRR